MLVFALMLVLGWIVICWNGLCKTFWQGRVPVALWRPEIAKLFVVSRKELLSHRRLAIRIFLRFN